MEIMESLAVITFEGGKSMIEQIKGKFGKLLEKGGGAAERFFPG